MALTVDFALGNTLVKLRYANARLDGFQQALIIRKLSGIYGTADINLSEIAQIAGILPDNDTARMETLVAAKIALDPLFAANFTVYQDIGNFAALAVRVAELHTDGLARWVKPSDGIEAIDTAFQHYLENAELWTAIADHIKLMDRPNGVEGAHPDQLSEVEKADPLSVNGAKNGATKSLLMPKTAPGKSTRRGK